MEASTNKLTLYEELDNWKCSNTIIKIAENLNLFLEIPSKKTLDSSLIILQFKLNEIRKNDQHLYNYLIQIIKELFSTDISDSINDDYEERIMPSEVMQNKSELILCLNFYLYHLLVNIARYYKRKIDKEKFLLLLQVHICKRYNLNAQLDLSDLFNCILELFSFIDSNEDYIKDFLNLLLVLFKGKKNEILNLFLAHIPESPFNSAFIEKINKPDDLKSFISFCYNISALIKINKDGDKGEMATLLETTTLSLKQKNNLKNIYKSLNQNKSPLEEWTSSYTTIKIFKELCSFLQIKYDNYALNNCLALLKDIVLKVKHANLNLYNYIVLILNELYNEETVNEVMNNSQFNFDINDLNQDETELIMACNYCLYSMIMILIKHFNERSNQEGINEMDFQSKAYDEYNEEVLKVLQHFEIVFDLFLFIKDKTSDYFKELLKFLHLLFKEKKNKIMKAFSSIIDESDFNNLYIRNITRHDHLKSIYFLCSNMICLIEINNTYGIKREEKIKLIEKTSFSVNQKQELKNIIMPMSIEMTDITSNAMISNTQEFENASTKLKISWLEKSLSEHVINTNRKLNEFETKLKQFKEDYENKIKDSDKRTEDLNQNQNKQIEDLKKTSKEQEKRMSNLMETFQHQLDYLKAELEENKLKYEENERNRKETEKSLFGIQTD